MKDAFNKYVKLVISGDLALDVLKTLELPYELGDTIELDLKPKQTQGKLTTVVDEDVKDSSPTKRSRKKE